MKIDQWIAMLPLSDVANLLADPRKHGHPLSQNKLSATMVPLVNAAIAAHYQAALRATPVNHEAAVDLGRLIVLMRNLKDPYDELHVHSLRPREFYRLGGDS